MVEFLLVRKWEKRNRTNFYWEVLKILLVRISSIQYGSTGTFWYRKLYKKTWYSSKIFMNFINFSCLIFFQNVSILLWIIYALGILEQFGAKNYTWRLDIVQNLCKFCLIFWAQNVLIPRILLITPDQNVSIICVNNMFIENIKIVWRRKLYMKS